MGQQSVAPSEVGSAAAVSDPLSLNEVKALPPVAQALDRWQPLKRDTQFDPGAKVTDYLASPTKAGWMAAGISAVVGGVFVAVATTLGGVRDESTRLFTSPAAQRKPWFALACAGFGVLATGLIGLSVAAERAKINEPYLRMLGYGDSRTAATMKLKQGNHLLWQEEHQTVQSAGQARRMEEKMDSMQSLLLLNTLRSN
jgi:hypothetical protein